MNLMFTSKTYELTTELKDFFTTKLVRLEKFSSLQLENVEVLVDKVKRHGRATSETKVELQLKLAGERINFIEEGQNIKQAFFNVYEKMEHRLSKELDTKKAVQSGKVS